MRSKFTKTLTIKQTYMNATEKENRRFTGRYRGNSIPEECLKEIFVDNHSMFTEESKEGESEVNFMNRAFCKALRKESIVNSTKQCMIINAPVGHGKMSSEEIELLSTYINRWTNNAEHYSMNWGLYEIPNTTKMRITILASSPTRPQAEENETQDVKNILVLRNAFEKTRKENESKHTKYQYIKRQFEFSDVCGTHS